MNNEIISSLKEIVSEENIFIDEPMSRHTTFRTGGPAALFICPKDQEEVLKAVERITSCNLPCFIIGNGSNLLVSDKGFDGVVISLEHLDRVCVQGDSNQTVTAKSREPRCTTIIAQAGALNSSIAAFARDHALAGFEFAAGIPGTIGGAMIMNAGAYDGEMKDIVKEVKVITPTGEVATLSNDDMEFGYRTSAIKGKGYIVLSVALSLNMGMEKDISEKMKELALKRKEKQPLEYPSAGSTFKRPEGYFAGKLIQDAGLRGFSIGGAQVSEKHCGFVINKGNATSRDIYDLIQEVKKRVCEDSGVMLEPEVLMLGEF